MTGFFLINKPVGITSHDVIDRLRKITGERRIGHAGTLDPLACGLLIIAVGRENTKNLSKFVGLDKEYLATITLGKTSTTYDAEGEIQSGSSEKPDKPALEKVLKQLSGNHEQMPPAYSAKKIGGQTAHSLARKGKLVELSPVPITVHKIELLNYDYPNAEIRVKVSSGTYIRSLAHDIGQKLGTGAYLSKLMRTKIGKYSIENSIDLRKIININDLEAYRINID